MPLWLLISMSIGTAVGWLMPLVYPFVAIAEQLQSSLAEMELPEELASISTYTPVPGEKDRNRTRLADFRDSLLQGKGGELRLTSDDVNALLSLGNRLGPMIPPHYAIEGDRVVERTGTVIPDVFGQGGYFTQESSIRYEIANGALMEVMELKRKRFDREGEVLDTDTRRLQKPIRSSAFLIRIFSTAAKFGDRAKIVRVLDKLDRVDIRDREIILKA